MWHATLASSPAIASARLSIFCIKAVSLSLSWCTRSSGLRCGRIIYKFQSKELVLFSDSSFGLLRHSEIAAIIHYFSVIGFLRLTSHNENVSFTSAMFYQAIRDAKRIVWLSKCLESEEQVWESLLWMQLESLWRKSFRKKIAPRKQQAPSQNSCMEWHFRGWSYQTSDVQRNHDADNRRPCS